MIFAPGIIPLVYCSHVDHDERVITIDEIGISSAECCVLGKCYCSNLSLALENIRGNAIISLQQAIQFEGTNDTTIALETFKNITGKYDIFRIIWLQEFILQFTLIITHCLNNFYGPAQVFMCCDDHNCDGERYKYTVDSINHNVIMISNDIIAYCPGSKECTLQIVSTANVNTTLSSMNYQINIKIVSSKGSIGYCENDIAHFSPCDGSQKCLLLSCKHSNSNCFPHGIYCFQGYVYTYDRFIVTPGYWFSNGFTEYVDNCPQGHCSSTFDLYASIYYASNNSYPVSNDLCVPNWTGLACGECDNDNYIIHDSTSCVPLKKCNLKDSYGVILFFLVSLLYWIIVISLIFMLLHINFNITVGNAYGIIFYFSVLEQTVKASYIGTYNNLNSGGKVTFLTVLSSIGNMKPPFQLLKLCFWKKASMIDHMFLTYIHPVIVTSLIVTIFLLARNFVTVARTVGRYINSKSICILLMLSYSSVSYTSMQLLRPIAIRSYFYAISSFHLYLSPNVEYFDTHFMQTIIYFIISLLCELIVGIGFPFVLVSQRYLTRYLNINFTSIKPIVDQLKGCYKEEYHWFAAYYLLCRQVIYAVDIATDFAPFMKFPVMVCIYLLIVMVHVCFQPYKQKKLNVLDTCILMILTLVFIGEHITYGSTAILWILPLILLINCIALHTKLKYLLIPISCLGMIALCFVTPNFMQPEYSDYQLDNLDDMQSNASSLMLVVLCISFLIFLTYTVYLCVRFIKRYCRCRAQYTSINEQNEDPYEDSDNAI